MQPFDIVGYVYKADVYCTGCIVKEVAKDYSIVLDGSEKDYPETYSTQPDFDRALNCLFMLTALGGDYDNEYSYDSDDFPKVIFNDQDEDNNCCICHERLRG